MGGCDRVGIGSALAFFIQASNIEAVRTEYTYIRTHRVSSNGSSPSNTVCVKHTQPTVL